MHGHGFGFSVNFLQGPNCSDQNAEGSNAQNRPSPPTPGLREYWSVGVDLKESGSLGVSQAKKWDDFV